jgi:hypothetical protein
MMATTLRTKQLCGKPRITIGERRFKRYHVTDDGAEIPQVIQEAAYAFVPQLLPRFEDDTEPAGFIVLHQTADSVRLHVYSWVCGNELHARCAAAGETSCGVGTCDLTTFQEVHQPLVGGVWELAPVAHEPVAWVRHVHGAEQPDVHAYLADLLPDGPVGASPQ